jgi:hypothetical protein
VYQSTILGPGKAREYSDEHSELMHDDQVPP